MIHIGKLRTLYDITNRKVVDIGAGDGKAARELAALGAIVTGIEIHPEKVALAQAEPAENVTFLLSCAENLSLPDASQDLACFFFSLHHIPLDVQDAAMTEAHRVLKPDGRVHVADPLPFGPLTEVAKAIDADETHMRTQSQARLDRLAQTNLFSLLLREEYEIVRRYRDFDALIRRLVMVDPVRAARLDQVREELERQFHALAVWNEDHYVLTQPCVMYHFIKAD
jgi:SAM-dependent methyltransferase